MAAVYAGGEEELDALEAFFGLEPLARRHRYCLYSRSHIDAAMAQQETEGRWPTVVETREKLKQVRNRKGGES